MALCPLFRGCPLLEVNPFFTFIVFNMQVQTMVKCKMIIVMIPLSETASDLGVVEIHSYVRGYHIYMDLWDAQVGQELPTVKA